MWDPHSTEGLTGLQLYYLFRNTYYFRKKYFPWYRNIIFFGHHFIALFPDWRGREIVLGRGGVIRGMVLGIWDFLSNRMGECRIRAF